jgi:hypothetical protein
MEILLDFGTGGERARSPGQETVQGNNKSMREDIFKKHISGDKAPPVIYYTVQYSVPLIPMSL